MASYDYRITYSGNQANLVIQTLRHGEVLIKFKFVNMPDGSKGFCYDSFNLTIGQEMQTISDEEELANDISSIMYLYENPKGEKRDFIIDTFDEVVTKHIKQYNRIVDTDLSSTIAYMGIALNALAQKEPNGTTITQEGKMHLLEMLMVRTEQKFGNYLYLTRYHRTPQGLQPYLISFNELKKNLRNG